MSALRGLAAFLFRGFALIVLGLVVLFPAYKGIWLGYVPVAAGFGLALLWLRRAEAPLLPRLRDRDFLLLILLAPAAIQAGLLLGLRPLPQSDGLFVYEEAAAFLQTGRLSPLTYYPPAQALWYVAWFKVFGVSPLVAQFSHLPLHALVTLLTYGLARRAAPGSARAAGVAVAFYPSFLGYVLTTPYYHYLYTAAVVGTAWGWLASFDRPRAAWSAGLASGFGALTKATQLIAPGQALFFWLLAPPPAAPETAHHPPVTGHRPPVTLLLFRLALFLLGMVLLIAPWTARNWHIFGELVPVCTSGGLVLHSANNPESNGLYSPTPDRAEVRTPAEMLAHSRASAKRAKAFIRENPGRFLGLAGRKILHTWGGEATFAELINRRGRPIGRLEDVFSAAFLAGWAALVFVWAAGAWRALRAGAPLTSLELACAVVVGSNLLVYALFEGGDRHHLPLAPLIVVNALAVFRASCGKRNHAVAGVIEGPSL